MIRFPLTLLYYYYFSILKRTPRVHYHTTLSIDLAPKNIPKSTSQEVCSILLVDRHWSLPALEQEQPILRFIGNFAHRSLYANILRLIFRISLENKALSGSTAGHRGKATRHWTQEEYYTDNPELRWWRSCTTESENTGKGFKMSRYFSR